jgi:hypothetical protein
MAPGRIGIPRMHGRKIRSQDEPDQDSSSTDMARAQECQRRTSIYGICELQSIVYP